MYKKTGEKNEFLVLTDEHKNTIIAEFLEQIRYEDRDYAVLLEENEDEVLIFGYNENGKDEFYTEIPDDAVIEAVFEIFRKNNEDEFDFDGD